MFVTIASFSASFLSVILWKVIRQCTIHDSYLGGVNETSVTAHVSHDIQLTAIGHVRYINILTWLRGFRVKIVNFLSFFCLSIPKRDSNTKKTTPNIEVWPESLGAMLEYWYIERGLLFWDTNKTLQKPYRNTGTA